LVLPSCTAVPAPVLTAGLNAATNDSSLFSGSTQGTYALPVDMVRTACVRAGEDLQYDVRQHATTNSSVTYFFLPRRGDPLKVTIVQHTPVVTTVRVRVGLLGDQNIARFLLAEIDKRIQIPPP
jgi:hypothetical protein